MTEGNYPKADINDIGEALDSLLVTTGMVWLKKYIRRGGYMLVGYTTDNRLTQISLFDLSGQ